MERGGCVSFVQVGAREKEEKLTGNLTVERGILSTLEEVESGGIFSKTEVKGEGGIFSKTEESGRFWREW